MKFLICLGNPDLKYANTRHNTGFMVADFIANENSLSFNYEKKFEAQTARLNTPDNTIIIVKPQTYMNLSGISARTILSYYKANPDDILVVFDDLSLNLGSLRFRAKGSAGGHNGIKSIISELQTENFARLKVGIGPQPEFMKAEAFVLGQFRNDEKELLSASIKVSANASLDYFKEGILKCQAKYNC